MRIQSLQLKNFKRFTDVTLQGIPANAKLVLLIGSNGSGKSSVFDAFEAINKKLRQSADKNNFHSFSDPGETEYYHKKKGEIFEIRLLTDGDSREQLLTTNGGVMYNPGNFYGRTSFRQIPRLRRRSLGNEFDVQSDSDRPASFIDRDDRLENDLEHIFGKLLREYFVSRDRGEIHDQVIVPLNQAFEKIFKTKNGTTLSIIELIPPLDGKTAEVNFKKGKSTFHYNYLSAGEKEIFNILINLIARKEYFQDTIYFFDEIDLHLNTKLQYSLLKEITENWIPENCQLWTASHSLGFIQYAKKSEDAVIFDFDDFDFDYPKVLSPEPKDNPDIYEIAVNKEILNDLFKGFEIIRVENEDKKYYASLNIERTLFIPEANRDSVFHKSRTALYKGIVDRDFLTDDDIALIEQQYPSLKVLKYYCIENYLFHPDNLHEYYTSRNKPFNKAEYVEGIFIEKEKVKSELLIKIASIRQAYPYFKEVGVEKLDFKKRFTPDEENYVQSQIIAAYLNSSDFNEFYKSLSMKDYAKNLPGRQNINPVELSKTNWFKTQIENIIK